MKTLRIATGLILLAVGVVLVFVPLEVAEALQRPARTSSEIINLRASFGGSVAGLGVFALACDALRPWRRSIATLVLCTMATVGAARAIGFVLDGAPDRLQWVWLIAEVLLVAASGAYLYRTSPQRGPVG